MTHPFNLSGKKIAVTGATSPIGESICRQIVLMGGEVIAIGRNQEKLNQLFQNLGEPSGLSLVLHDFSNQDSGNSLIEALPVLDGFVSGAALLRPKPVRFINETDFEEVFKLNFWAPVKTISSLLAAKKIAHDCSFVFISSVSANHPYIGGLLYTAAKAALDNFSKVLVLEGKHMRLRSNSILPAMVKSGMFDQSEQFVGKDLLDEHLKAYPLGPGNPEDVANAAVFLLSGASRWISGTSLVLDGGLTMYP
jgi:NAD(P)-dependent dehydrogenase (short-subunit alcohol dehydrogenase family)